MQMESKTVVMPAATSCASCARNAALADGQMTCGPRHEMFFQIIRMQFHQTGKEIIPLAIHAGGTEAVSAYVVDAPLPNAQTALHNTVGGDQFRVPENMLFHIVSHLDRIRNVYSPAARICRHSSATASRTASSWKIPTTAAPRSLASRINSITNSRLAASSEAVGSSRSNIGLMINSAQCSLLLLLARKGRRGQMP